MSEDRKKPGVAFWATVVVIVVLLYVLSFGPACWIISRSDLENPVLPSAYAPFGFAARKSVSVRSAMIAYGRLWVQRGSYVNVPTGADYYFGIIVR